jgi:hypothetical protein
MTAKIAATAMALVANGLCLFWSSGTAPAIATRPARCVMATRQAKLGRGDRLIGSLPPKLVSKCLERTVSPQTGMGTTVGNENHTIPFINPSRRTRRRDWRRVRKRACMGMTARAENKRSDDPLPR